MAKNNIFQVKIDKNVNYVLLRGDFAENTQKAVLSGTEFTVLAENKAKLKIVVEDGYEVKNVACLDYSMVYRTAWQVTSFEKEQGLLCLEKIKGKNLSDNVVVSIETQKKQPMKKKEVVLSEHPFWVNIANGEHLVQIKNGNRIVCEKIIVKE